MAAAKAGQLSWGSKAETLERLQGRLRAAQVLPQLRFTVSEWQQNPTAVLAQLQAQSWSQQALIVRSSALQEDSEQASLAGHFSSILNVTGEQALSTAIEEVIRSFEQFGQGAEQQIFVQPMLNEITLSGVAFSRDPNTGSPYLVINYDNSGSSDSVTSGRSNGLCTYYHYRPADFAPPAPLDQIANLITELESLLPAAALDLEFAFDKQGQLWLLQVRPLVLTPCSPAQEAQLTAALQQIARHFRSLNRPHPYLHGKQTIFGVMPDWNPAEIIGIRPGVLARTLYQELITDNIWAYQRHNYGYRNLRSFPLLQSFGGCPYIDVRLSFNSFMPADLPPELAERLAQYYLDRLGTYPSYHDKVEFEILFSCYTLDLPERLQVLQTQGFSETETQTLANSLRQLTQRIIHPESGLWKRDIERIQELERRQQTLKAAGLEPVAYLYWLLEDCKRYGTLPFAGLARAGFIAVQMLRSLVSSQILSPTEYSQFMGQLETISTGMGRDFARLSREDFLARYGHLRPGTYDINSARYDEAPERYFDWAQQPRPSSEPPPFALSLAQFRAIEQSLRQHQLELDVLGLFDFIKQAIEGREYAKFVFTRSLSEALSQIATLAQAHGLSLQAAAQLNIDCLRQLYTSSQETGKRLQESAAQGLAQAELTRQLVLPPLISQEREIWSFCLEQGEPNFITLGQARGPACSVAQPHSELPGSILFIESADPGYDWIFSHGIAGFITMYGGANSHMAIRAGELGLPAVIGAGEVLYRRWAQGQLLELDCANHQVRVLQ